MKWTTDSRRALCAAIAAAFALAASAWLMAHPSQERTVEDFFEERPNAYLAPYLWEAQPGLRVYRLFIDMRESAALEITWRGAAESKAHVNLERQGRLLKKWPLPPGTAHLNLTPHLQEPGEFFVRLQTAEAAAEASFRPEKIRFIFKLPATQPHLGQWLFFAALSAVCWGGLAFFLIPPGPWNRPKPLPFSGQYYQSAKIALTICLAGAICLLVADGHWRSRKDFDDFHAIGPAASMARHGFDSDMLFFRARVRPAFAAWLAPVEAIFPLRFASISKWRQDRYKRWFSKYDRANSTFGYFHYREFSALSLALLLGCIALISGMFSAAGMSPAQKRIGLLIVAGIFILILDNVITFSFITAMLWSAAAAACWAARRGGWARMLGAGCMLGAAALSKETALSLAPPVAMALALYTIRSKDRKRAAREAAICVAAAAAWPLVYYSCIIPGGFGNLTDLIDEHAYQQQLYPESFVALNPLEAIKSLWAFSGPFFALGLLGLAMELKRGRSGDFWNLFFAAWAIGGCLPFLSPYVLPRLLVDLTPATAYFCARLIDRKNSSYSVS